MGWLWTSIIKQVKNETSPGNCRFPSCCAEFRTHPQAWKRTLGRFVLQIKQRIGIYVGNSWVSACFCQRSTALNHKTTQNLEWLNFQFLFQHPNWNNFHLYSIRTPYGYFQPLKFHALKEGNWKLFSQTHKIQLSKIQNAARNHRFHTKTFWEWRNKVITLYFSTELSTVGLIKGPKPN